MCYSKYFLDQNREPFSKNTRTKRSRAWPPRVGALLEFVFARELIKTRKVKVMSESLLLHPYEPACIASRSRYQSTLWPSAVPQLCSGSPQAWARKLCSKHSGIFVGSSRIIKENLSLHFSLLFLHIRRVEDTSPMTMQSTIKLFMLVVNLAPQMPLRNIYQCAS